MGKTFRRVPEHFVSEEEMESNKIKRVDKKHQKVTMADGVHTSYLEDDEGGYAYVTQHQKNAFKKLSHKRERKVRFDVEEDDE